MCFYHLVPAGRGSQLAGEDLPPHRRRAAIDRIIDLAAAHPDIDVLTVDNHADGPYLHLRLLREDPEKARRALDLLGRNRGNASGVRLACVSAAGRVHPDQFWRAPVLGNVRERSFADIWADTSAAGGLTGRLRARPRPVTGRCAACRWLDVCNGNLRARAEALTGDPWASDPACYLTDAEIGLTEPAEAADAGGAVT